MNIRNKIGQFSQVMILMLILASAIVLLLFVTKFVTRSTIDESISACRLSVMTQAATSFGIISKTSPLDINCDKRYVNFYNTRAELGLSLENMNPINIDYGDHKAKKFSELNEFIVDQVVAEELRVCKFEFGDGKIDIFPNDKSGMLTGKNVCYICSEINFKPGVGSQKFTNLVDYTKKTTFTEQGVTYYNYLTEVTVQDNNMWSQPTYDPTIWEKIFPKGNYNNLEIDSNQAYIVFVEKAQSSKLDLLHWGRPIWVAMVPAKDINIYCDLQAS